MCCCLPCSQAVDGVHKYAMLLCYLQPNIAVQQYDIPAEVASCDPTGTQNKTADMQVRYNAHICTAM